VYVMPADGAAMKSRAFAAHLSVQIERASPNCGSDSGKVLQAFDSTNACSSAMSSSRMASAISFAVACMRLRTRWM
jgi:hypothetical protein